MKDLTRMKTAREEEDKSLEMNDGNKGQGTIKTKRLDALFAEKLVSRRESVHKDITNSHQL